MAAIGGQHVGRDTIQVLEAVAGTWCGAADQIIELIRANVSSIHDVLSIDAHNDNPDADAVFHAMIRRRHSSVAGSGDNDIALRGLTYFSQNNKRPYAEQWSFLAGLSKLVLANDGRVISITSSCNSSSHHVSFLFYTLPFDDESPSPSSPPPSFSGSLRVMTFNIWCGGGKSLFDTAEVIRSAQPDIVGLQESSNSITKLLARVLGMYCDEEQWVLSRYPLSRGSASSSEVLVDLGSSIFSVYNVHTTAYPYPPYKLHLEKWSFEDVIESERAVQMDSISSVLESLGVSLACGSIVLLMGDFNAASHLDYADTDQPIVFPLSKYCADIGLLDTYYYSPRHDRGGGCEPPRGHTWTPQPSEEEHGIYDRIDFIYLGNGGDSVVVANSYTIDGDNSVEAYPSDHRAVLTEFHVR